MDEMNFADAINSILSDPETGGKIKDIVQSLSGGSDGSSLGAQSTQNTPNTQNFQSAMPDISKIMKFKSMYDSAMHDQDPRVMLLTALRPYLSAQRAKNLDACIKFLRFYKIAGMLKDSDILKELF